jgi:uncharacterized protein (DUF3084 family)
MLIRICLIVAIIAGLAVGGLNFVKVKEKVVDLKTNLATTTDERDKARTDLASTRSKLKNTEDKLKTTEQTLATTTEERDRALTDASTQQKRADKLNEDLTKTRGERDAAQQELAAYSATGLKPEQIIQINKDYKGLQANLVALQGENRLLGQKIVRLTNELAVYKDPEHFVALPANLRGKVLVTDPKWNFVVLNIGEDQGVLEHGELLINRDGKLVAKVKVRSVQKDRSIANIVPGWQLGDVMEGDQVIPAHPASS